MGCRFVKRLTAELKDIRTGYWIYERPRVFENIILTTVNNFQSSKDIPVCMERQMYLWYQGRFMEMVDNTIMARWGGGGEPGQGGSEAPCEYHGMRV